MQKSLRSTAALCVLAALGGTGVASGVTGLMHYDYRTAATVMIDAASSSMNDRKTLVSAIPAQTLSNQSLDRIVRDLHLDANPLFMGTEMSATGVVIDLLAPREVAPEEREALLRKRLSSSLGVTETAGSIAVVTTTPDPELSATLGNHVADRIVASVNAGSFAPAPVKASPIAQKRVALETAEQELRAFEAAHDSNSLVAMQNNQDQLAVLKQEMDRAAQELADSRIISEQAAKISLADVFTRNIPDDSLFLPLVDLRQRYAVAKVVLEEVSVSHGPKHPRVIAANDTISTIRKSADAVLKRLQADVSQQQKQRSSALEAVTRKRTELLEAEAAYGEDAEKFRALHAAVDMARNDYNATVNEGEVDSPIVGNAFSAVVSSRADAAQATTNRPDSVVVGLIGALCGLACAIAFALARRIKRRGQKVASEYSEMRSEEHNIIIEPVKEPVARPQVLAAKPVNDAGRMTREDHASIRSVLARSAPDTIREVTPMPYDAYNPAYGEREPVADTARQAVYYEPPHFAAVADNNDVSVADRVLAVLANGGSGRHATAHKSASDFPPLLEAAMRGDIRYREKGQDMRQPLRRMEDLPPHYEAEKREDLEEVRREMAELSNRVRSFASRRGAAR